MNRREMKEKKKEEQDFLVGSMLSLFVEAGIELNVTLFVNGTMISGTIISKEQYLENVKVQLTKSCKEERKVLRGKMEKAVDMLKEKGKKKPPHYLYLKKIVTWNKGNEVIEDAYLCVKTEKIDGFIWGTPSE